MRNRFYCALPFEPDFIVLGGESLTLWRMDSTGSLPTWHRTWETNTGFSVLRCVISACGTFLAAQQEGSNILQVWRIAPMPGTASTSQAFVPCLVSEIYHPEQIGHFHWKPDASTAKWVICQMKSTCQLICTFAVLRCSLRLVVASFVCIRLSWMNLISLFCPQQSATPTGKLGQQFLSGWRLLLSAVHLLCFMQQMLRRPQRIVC